MKLRSSTSQSKIISRIGGRGREGKRSSRKRKNRLEKLARWTSGHDVRVEFVTDGAKCAPVSGSGPDYAIHIPKDEHEQPVTDLKPEVWDFVFQKAELFHELGHVIYTDFKAFREYQKKAEEPAVFKNLWNAVEDGAIERQIIASWNVAEELEVKNKNLLTAHPPGSFKTGNGQILTWFEGVVQILLDWAKWDTGRTSKLLDPADDSYIFKDPESRSAVVQKLPLLREMVSEIVHEPDPEVRAEKTFEYYQELVDDFREHCHRDPERGTGAPIGGDDGRVFVVRPGGNPPKNAENIELTEDDTVIVLPGEMGGEKREGEESLGERYGEQVENDGEESEEELEGVKNWHSVIQETGNDMTVVEDGDGEREVWQRGERYGQEYKRSLKRVLQSERASSHQRNQRAGRPDMQSLWKLKQGNNRVFSNEKKPEEKDYSVIIMVDRSGSMGGDASADMIVDEAEAVAVGLTLALEALGAEVCVISYSGYKPMLEKPFGVDAEEKKDILTRGFSKSNTPLGRALENSLARLQQREGESLIFSITDGYPSDEDKYIDALESATVPICGVYFGSEIPDNADEVRNYYHRFDTASKETLSHTVQGLIKRMMT